MQTTHHSWFSCSMLWMKAGCWSSSASMAASSSRALCSTWHQLYTEVQAISSDLKRQAVSGTTGTNELYCIVLRLVYAGCTTAIGFMSSLMGAECLQKHPLPCGIGDQPAAQWHVGRAGSHPSSDPHTRYW